MSAVPPAPDETITWMGLVGQAWAYAPIGTSNSRQPSNAARILILAFPHRHPCPSIVISLGRRRGLRGRESSSVWVGSEPLERQADVVFRERGGCGARAEKVF